MNAYFFIFQNLTRNFTFSKFTDKINLSLNSDYKYTYYAFKEFESIAHHNVKKFKRLYVILLATKNKKLDQEKK